MANTNLTGYLESSPPLFEAVFWGSVVLLLAIFLMILGLLLSRLWYLYFENRRRRIRRNWIPVMCAVRDGKPVEISAARRSQLPMLIELWLDYRSHAVVEQAAALDDLAKKLQLTRGLEDILRPSVLPINTRPVWLQRIALNAAQWLQTSSVLRYVYEAAESDNLYLAVNACACLTRIKAPDYEQKVVTLLFRYPEQSAYISTELSQAGATDVLQLMEPFIDELPANMAGHFIALSDFSQDRSLLPLLTRRIERAAEGRELAILVRAIGRLGDNSHRDLIVRYLHDDRYYIRIQAIKALGRIGTRDDIPLVLPYLSDPEWWVRYRTARAIIRLLKRDSEAVEQLREDLPDRFARDILKHALTEMNWCLN